MATTSTTHTTVTPVDIDVTANTEGTLTFSGTWAGAHLRIQHNTAADPTVFTDYSTDGSPIKGPFNKDGGFPLTFFGTKLRLLLAFPTAGTTSVKTEVTTP